MNQDNPTSSPDNRAELEQPILEVDQSALEFYFEAVLPEIPVTLRVGMAAAIRRGIESKIAAQTLQARLEGAIEQIMQDFLSLNVQFDGCVDEKDLIEWRESQLAALKGEK